jgi:glycine cleavage system H protein
MEIRAELRYTKEHEWVRVEGETAVVGITDYAQEQLGDVVFVELPEVGSEVKPQGGLVVLESVKAVSDVYAPLSGTVVRCNATLADQPEVLNEDPYGRGWLVELQLADPGELIQLLDSEAYAKWVAKGDR